MRIEHTSNSKSRSTVLKTARDTSPNSLPLIKVTQSNCRATRTPLHPHQRFDDAGTNRNRNSHWYTDDYRQRGE